MTITPLAARYLLELDAEIARLTAALDLARQSQGTAETILAQCEGDEAEEILIGALGHIDDLRARIYHLGAE